MINFQEFLHHRLETGGFTTEDALASVLPLVREVAAAHQAGLVAPLAGLGDLHVEGVRIWFEEARRRVPVLQASRIRELDKPAGGAIDVVGEFRLTADADAGLDTVVSLQIGERGQPVTHPIYVPGYLSWEHEIGHHDPLTDIFSLGMILATLVCGLDFNSPDDLAEFVRCRRNLFELNPSLHPVLAKAVVRMTELSRHRRPQDIQALLRTLENYRDQDIDFDFDLARLPELTAADPQGKRELLLTRLQQRLFEISRRNRLLHFRPTMQTVNLTWASVPLSFDVASIRPEQILTWNTDFQRALFAGGTLSLNRYLRFEEALYLPGLLDEIRTEAQRDLAEFGFANLRLALCFLRWSNLKEKPPDRFDSPLVLLPVRLTKTKGVRDVYSLEPLGTEAEVNPVLRHYLKQLYAVELPEAIELTTTPLETLHEFLVARIQSSEPAVTVAKIDRPRIQLIHARAQRRLEQYQGRVRLSGRGIRSFLNIDYSYDRDNFHPLGLRLFQTRIRPPENRLRPILADTPRPRTFMLPATPPATDKERMLYSVSEEETNPYQWEFDLCNVTLGNFRYRKMSLVRDYEALLQKGTAHPAFEAIFSLEPRPVQAVQPEPPPLDEHYPIVPCDPTQASAIALARSGRDYIIQGPPGTGKSQTITNLIADYVVRGKRVLFVCEKRAAIDVVYHRLRQVGLDQLCCLIHDSQTDKKEFIQDLKQTYERLLEGAEANAQVERSRQSLVTTVKQELAPLAQFHEAMRTPRPATGVPLRGLLHRAVELRGQAPDLALGQRDRLPPYALWHENKERIARLAAALDEQGVSMLARHPLRLLSCRLATLDQPFQVVGEALDKVGKLLDTLASQSQQACLRSDEGDTLDKLTQLVDYGRRVHFLTEGNRLTLLRPDSELGRKLSAGEAAHQAKMKELARAQEATRNWRTKLPPQEVRTALEQARLFERSWFAFLRPSWWTLRAVLRRCYSFRDHAIKPSWTQVLEALHQEHEIRAALAELETQSRERFGFDGGFADFARQIAELRQTLPRLPEPVAALHLRLLDAPDGDEIIRKIERLEPVLSALKTELAVLLDGGGDLPLLELGDELDRIEEALDDLPDFLPCLGELAGLPPPLAKTLRSLPCSISEVEALIARDSLANVFRGDRPLARLTGAVRARHVRRLEQACEALHDANAAVVRDRVRRRFLENVRLSSLPHAQLTAEQKEFKGIYNRGRRELEHEFGKVMRYRSIRELVAGNPGIVIGDLKPVWLMSPLSVADALPLDLDHFDVVIFDEASQVTLEEAVPAIFRAHQVIVVGDEMQLPPTSFFSAKQADEDDTLVALDDAGRAVEYDLSSNSFLNHAARKLPATMLGWHYRSRAEALISFSNAAFYQGRLLSVPEVTLPAPELDEIRIQAADDGRGNVARLRGRPVSFHFLERGVYENRRNTAEAEYIAQLVRGLLGEDSGLSIGIVAFSEAQQDEIHDALERLAREDRAFRDRYEAELEREEDGQFVGLLVKNLENIQGDERDIVILSVCYGYGPTGKMLMNFGPINQNGGERRLNVAFSRAKQHMVVVSSIRHHDITNDYNDGARCLQNYLRYAEAVSIGDFDAARRVLRDMSLRDEPERDEAAQDAIVLELAAALRRRGCEVDAAVGQSRFRCDLALRRAGDTAYRLGILIDTDEYYRHSDLLECDVLKPKLLRRFGWTVAQVLSKDWYENPESVLSAVERILSGQAVEEDPADDEPEPSTASRDVGQTAGLPPAAAGPPSAPYSSADVAAAAEAAWTRSFEFIGGGSRKFWNITVEGKQHTVHFGRLDSAGQTRTKTFADTHAADRDARRLIQEKLAKGYIEKKA
jgi:predicted DNA-binding WGR domain protein